MRCDKTSSHSLVLIAAAVAAAVWLWIVPIRIGIQFARAAEKQYVGASVSIGRYIRLKRTFPLKRNGSARPRRLRLRLPQRIKTRLIRRSIAAMIGLTRQIPVPLRTVEQFRWKTVLGTGDAAVTALVTGAAWSLKSVVLAHFSRQLTFVHRPQLDVVPVFNQARLELDIDCIFRFTVGEIIRAVLPRTTS